MIGTLSQSSRTSNLDGTALTTPRSRSKEFAYESFMMMQLTVQIKIKMFVSAQVQWLFLHRCLACYGDDRTLERKGDGLYIPAISPLEIESKFS